MRFSQAVERWRRVKPEIQHSANELRRSKPKDDYAKLPTCAAELRTPPVPASDELRALLAQRDSELAQIG